MNAEELERILKEGEGQSIEFKDAGIIEEYSSGLRRISEALAENGSKPAEFHVDQHSFAVNVESLNRGSEKWSEKWSGVSERQRDILTLMQANPGISRKEISDKLGINQSVIQKHIKNLRKERKLKRVGPDKGGRWEVLDG